MENQKIRKLQKLLEYLEVLDLEEKQYLLEKMGLWVEGQRVRKTRKKGKYPSYYRKMDPWTQSLANILGRCNAKPGPSKRYKYYAARGIKCLITADQLKTIYHRDMAHLMKRPSINRIDPDGDYTPENCQYVELQENRRSAKRGRKKVTPRFQ